MEDWDEKEKAPISTSPDFDESRPTREDAIFCSDCRQFLEPEEVGVIDYEPDDIYE